MKFDPLLNLACSMQSKKGIYALLLGSGISRTSGIPTGWDITMDLIRKLAALQGANEILDPADWYIQKYGKEPDYSEILYELAKTPSERNNLLKEYFEPISEEDDPMLRKPTEAHKAIAKLIKDGYIRVVITTNFDRLLETALSEIGIVPNVISNSDQLRGAIPLIHSNCTILKVHGDYMDIRIKNTTSELSEYEPAMNDYIDRIMDEFGLIICGWSGEWDIALKKSIFRCKNNRYSCFWLKKGQLCSDAKSIIDFKKCEVIDIDGADQLFLKLQENIDSLNDLKMRQNPLSIDIACASLKRLLPYPQNIIRINDLILDESKNLVNSIMKLDWAIIPDALSVKERIEQLENLSMPLVHLITIGCYWSDKTFESIWINSFKLIYNSKLPSTNGIYTVWEKISKYPALLILYIVLMSSIRSENYNLLFNILNNTFSNKNNRYEAPVPISKLLYPSNVIEREICNKALFQDNKYVPVSERLFDVLREPIAQIVTDEDEYNDLFDKAEYFYAVNYWFNETLDERYGRSIEKSWAPIGKFGYKLHNFWKSENIFKQEIVQKEDWAAISAGFFGNSFEIFIKCSEAINKWIAESSFFF